MNEFTKQYAALVARYIDTDEIENFHEDFEELLGVYENDNDDEPNEEFYREGKPDDFTDIVKNVLAGKKPKIGKIYRDKNGERYLVVDADDFATLHLTEET